MREILQKYNIQAPRYTSYPPATEFKEDFDTIEAKAMIIASNDDKPDNISLYFHFPYCPQTCHFCGCNSYLQKSDDQAGNYIKALLKEVETLFKSINLDRQVTQIHWGGGTPNSLDYKLLGEVMTYILDRVKLSPEAEVAIECNPAYLTRDNIPQLRDIGFNRLSLGIQDFDPAVLKAVNREPSLLDHQELMDLIRANGFDGVNMDFIYGLPLQSVDSYLESLKKAISLKPNRLVTFSYAHVPWVKSEQKKLDGLQFPDPEQKMEMLLQGMELLKQSGYQMIGMDHYALPDDPLGKASIQGKLHRNFQGYCTRETTGQVYAFGASSISQLTGGFLQNIRHPEKYIEAISKTGSAIQRGYKTTKDQRIIGDSITEIMCNGYLRLPDDEIKKVLNFDVNRFSDLQDDGLLTVNENEIQLTDTGKLLSRVVAMRLDPLMVGKVEGFSKTI